MVQQVEILLSPFPRGIHLVTQHILSKLPDLPQEGILQIFIKHTSAGLTINENADPSVRDDFNSFLNRMVPEKQSLYTHCDEGLDDMPAHLKASLVGFSVSIPISNGRLNLGTWQGIYLCEFRNSGGSRRLVASIIS